MNMRKTNLSDLTHIALFAAVMAVCSWISVPMTVPFTLQTFGVFLAVRLLGGKKGTVALMLYMLLGLVGLPVFSGFKSGPAALIGPTGGYLVGFFLISSLYWALEKKLENRFLKDAVLYAGLLLCYALGTAWFVYLMGLKGSQVSVGYALSVCVLPFMIPDFAKLVLSDLAASQLTRALKRLR